MENRKINVDTAKANAVLAQIKRNDPPKEPELLCPINPDADHDLGAEEYEGGFSECLAALAAANLGLAYDTLHQIEVLRATVLPWAVDLGRTLDDNVLRVIRHFLSEQCGVDFSKENVYEAAKTLAQQNRFNPVQEYLGSLKWDGVKRVETLLVYYMGAKDSEYVRSVGQALFVAAVRRAFKPGTKFDTMLIIEGEQGTAKSTAISELAGEFFSDAALGNLSNPQAAMALHGVWLYEVAELAGMGRAEVNELKAFVSRPTDRYRPPYGKAVIEVPRTCVFIGTINPEGGYLLDMTGNRRYWPVRTGKIDIEALRRDRDQLWAEAVYLEREGASIVLPEHLWAAAAVEQAARQVDDPWVDMLRTHLDDNDKSMITTSELFVLLNVTGTQCNPTAAKRLRAVMAALGWTYKRSVRVGERTQSAYLRGE